MKRFEYKTTFVAKSAYNDEIAGNDFDNDRFLANINQLGSEGWELVQVVPDVDTLTYDKETILRGFTSYSVRIPVAKTTTNGFHLFWKREL